jgi:hypothetical protein
MSLYTLILAHNMKPTQIKPGWAMSCSVSAKDSDTMEQKVLQCLQLLLDGFVQHGGYVV